MMLPKELKDIFDEFDEDDLDIYITKVEFVEENFIVDFDIVGKYLDDSNDLSQKWTIEARGYKNSHISFDFASFMEIKDNHPLLWAFTDIQCELYFTGQCQDPAKLFYDLYLKHKSLFSSYQPFTISFHEEAHNFKLFHYSNGLLARGAKKLMEEYASCLKRNNLDFNIIGDRPAKYWDGKQFILENQDLNILFLGKTYIVAKDFLFLKR